MTPDPATPETVLALIASHGGDMARWPQPDREAAAMLLASTPSLAAALAEAQQLDAVLNDWARAPMALPVLDAAAITGLPQLAAETTPALTSAPSRPLPRRWLAGGAMAAAASVALLVFSTHEPAPQVASAKASAPSAAVAGEAEGSDAAFAYVFTPTLDEDELI